ncbi:glutathione S-transferase family protein [Methylocystis bryophila]|uniref:Glutathione S-transferase n=1 Tax=Methylocystis bryophila TaxID=655015 RepID=A0A1W6MVE0_9HYPH|nr:glutathione S-transferase family protein [Methylocystis bryophila]ARN81537.1 glutathione S-transferase [Methylocystis bryophila]BDV37563.1 glutathione S-transferase [Methylocystis bryophila]
MTPATLVIGNKGYSSWSFRPWMVMKEFAIPFQEEVVPLYRENSKAKLLTHSSAGKVPVLIHDGLHVWDSLAIIEYLAERYPALPIWPRKIEARAHARALAAEMHAGFTALRKECPTNFRRKTSPVSLSEAASADLSRIDAAWREARARFGEGGPFLYGAFSAADAMFAPVVNRVEIYGLPVSPDSRTFVEAVKNLASWKSWHAGAQEEEWRLPQFELA